VFHVNNDQILTNGYDFLYIRVIDKKTPLKIYRKSKTEFESVYGVIGLSENWYKYFIVEIEVEKRLKINCTICKNNWVLNILSDLACLGISVSYISVHYRISDLGLGKPRFHYEIRNFF
jgi:hypothetical protein